MKTKRWLAGWLLISLALLLSIAAAVIWVDPYMHFHAPKLDKYYYTLENQRSVNDGISKYFDYDAIITGSSMSENFKCSLLDCLFGVKSIKIPYVGATYKELNNCISAAARYNPNLRLVVSPLDTTRLIDSKDSMRHDLGEFPTYLYDNNHYNDIKYIFNRHVVKSTLQMLVDAEKNGFEPGITDFDHYSSWQAGYPVSYYGWRHLLPDGVVMSEGVDTVHLSDEDRTLVHDNVMQNVVGLAKACPEVEFYFFFPPYSMVYWYEQMNDGTAQRMLEAERYAIELILEQNNIYLYSFNDRLDIIGDLNNYKDMTHYGIWINDLILHWMKEGQGRLTKDNYLAYSQREAEQILSFDYTSLTEQPDYEDNRQAAEKINKLINDGCEN